MKRILFYLILSLVPAVSGVTAGDDIYDLIRKGKLDDARAALAEVSTAALRDGNHLFFQALLEPNGDRAAQLMEVALNSHVDLQYREEIYLRLAEYYYLTGNHDRLRKLIVDYRVNWEKGEYREQMMRYSTMLDEQDKAYESALRQADRYLVEYSEGDAEQWGEVDKARVLIANGKNIGAVEILRKLSRARSGPGVPQALYLLTLESIHDKRADDAIFYYNILREGYPAAIGLDPLVDKMEGMTTGSSASSAEAEKLTGTYYSVQVGVFSEKGNADKMADKFRRYDVPVDIRSKTISNSRYRVVFVGHYGTYNQAAAAKAKFEAENNEVYQVVAR